MLNWLFRARRMQGDVRAMRSGPQAYGKRLGRRSAHRLLSRLMR
ncbi:hypothetical protein [Kocuria palustris]|nr:hypothetical protein [Kocuria palustris]